MLFNNGTFSENMEKCLFFLFSLSCALIGFPSEMSIPALLCYVLFLILFSSLVLLKNEIRCKVYEAQYILIIFVFFIYCFLNSIISYSNGYEFTDWLVSMVSVFSLFITILMIFSKLEIDYIIKVIIGVSFLWTVKVFIEVLQVMPISAVFGIRITGVVIDSVMPYPLVAAVFTLFYLCKKNKLAYFLYVWFCLFIIMVGYKAVIALVAVATLLYFLNSGLKISNIIIFGVLIFILFVFGIQDYVMSRFDSIGGTGDVIRVKEIEEAMKLFEVSPLYGVGFGFSIPNSETAGLSKTYMHNSFVYLITSIGLFGLILYCVVLFGGLLNKSKLNFLSLTLVLFLISSLTAASFKLFQFNYLLAILLLLNLKRDGVYGK